MSYKNTKISICKGIGIILMVIGHSGCPKPLHDFIYLFHMPLLFIITGYLFKKDYLETPYAFLKRKLYSLYKPFFISNTIVLSICTIIHTFTNKENETFIHFFKRFLKILFFTGQYDILGSLWFLRTLFFSNIIVLILFYIQKKYNFNIFFPIIISLLFLIAGNFIYIHYGQMFYDLQREMIPPILLIIGILYKKMESRIPQNMIFVILSFIVILFASRYFTFDMAGSIIYKPLIFIIFSIIGFYMVYTISCYIGNIKLFKYIGDNSLSILLLHQAAFYSLQIINTKTLEYHKLCNNDYWILYSIYSIILSLLVNLIYKHIKSKYEKNNNISPIR